MSLVVIKKVHKTYRLDDVVVCALQDINLRLAKGRFTVISGQSGSGKTTLLNMIGCIDRPDSGELIVAGCETNKLSDDELSDFRARNLGYVFQNFNLLPVLTAYENVEFPLLLSKHPEARRKERVSELLAAVGLSDKMHRRPSELSGGQRQRVAIARALAHAPQIVLADEPTANLDSRTGADIIALMRRMQRDSGTSFVISSHDPQMLAEADDAIRIGDGRVLSASSVAASEFAEASP